MQPDYWGAADPDHATCIALTTPATGVETCNGNGNGKIFDPAGNEFYEVFRAWQQLANAELIKGNYTGVAGADGVLDSEPGVNVPEGVIDGSSWMMQELGAVNIAKKTALSPAWDMFFDGKYAHILGLGALNATVMPGIGNLASRPTLTAEDAYALDIKTDDGRPGTGIQRSFMPVDIADPVGPYYYNDCATTNDPKTAEYNLLNEDVECIALFNTKF